MSRKRVNVTLKPGAEHTAEEWVHEDRERGGDATAPTAPQPAAPAMKRLTIDIPARLHRRLKMKAAEEDVKMADLVRAWIEGNI